MKKIIPLLIVFIAFATAVYADCFNGISNTTITICSCYDLDKVRLNVTGRYTIQNNLNCSNTTSWNGGIGFQPISNLSTRFSGEFNGQNYNISNLYINSTGLDYIGLFGITTAGANLTNIRLLDANVTGRDRVGILMGANVGLVNNSYSTGNVQGRSFLGGLMGENAAKLNFSSSNATIYGRGASPSYTGGLVGYNSDGTIMYSFATGSVDGISRSGGLVGDDTGTIVYSYATGNVNASSIAGGLVGIASGSLIIFSYATGNVTSVGSYAGGLVAFVQSSAIINNSYAMGNATGGSSVGGLVGYMQVSSVIDRSYATGAPRGSSSVGGLVGSVSSSTCVNSFWDNITSGQSSSACGTGKNTTDLLNVSTYTNNRTIGISLIWDFFGNPYNDTANRNDWFMNTTLNFGYPVLIGVGIGSIVDGKAPSVSFKSPSTAAGTFNQNSISINISVTESDLSVITIYLYNTSQLRNTTTGTTSPLYINHSLLQEGTYYVNVTVNDTLNNYDTTPKRTIILDLSAPNVTLENPKYNFFNDTNETNSITFNCSATDVASTANISLYISNNANGSLVLNKTVNLTGTYNYTNWTLNVPVGNYTFNCLVYDTVGFSNWSINRTFKLNYSDITAPLFNITSPVNNTNTSNTSIDILFTVSDIHLGNCTYSNDSMTSNTTLSNCANITTITWSEGVHNVMMWVNDTWKNNNQSFVHFTIDTIKPTIRIISPSNNTNTSNPQLNINYSASDLSLFSCAYSNDSFTSNITLNNCANITTVTWSEGSHTVIIYANDSAGNSNMSSVMFSVNSISPSITLSSPLNNSGDGDANVTFFYNASDASTIGNCSIILDYGVNITNMSVTKNIIQNFTINNIPVGRHNWSINCTSSTPLTGESPLQFFSIIPSASFAGRTTDFTVINITNISNLLVEQPNYGLINFTENIDLSNNTDLNSFVNISFNQIIVNSTAAPHMNRPATLKLYNLTFTNPRIVRDSDVCSGSICNTVSYTSGTYTFTVTQFSTYSAEETPSSGSSDSSSGGSSSGSAGSSGGGGIFAKDIAKPVTLSMREGGNYPLYLKGIQYTIQLSIVEADKVYIYFFSNGQSVGINIGETIETDVDADQIADLSIVVKRIYGKFAEIEFTAINTFPAEAAGGEEIVRTPEPTITLPTVSTEFVFAILLIFVLLMITIYNRYRRAPKREVKIPPSLIQKQKQQSKPMKQPKKQPTKQISGQQKRNR